MFKFHRIFTIVVVFLCLHILFSDSVANSTRSKEHDLPDKKLHLQCIYPTVNVSHESGCYGSGAIIRSDKVKDGWHNAILTCHHVVASHGDEDWLVSVPVYKKWSVFVKWEKYTARVLTRSKKYDLALMVFKTNRKMHCAEIELNAKVFIGSKIWKTGCAFRSEPRLEDGTLNAVNHIVNGVPHYRHTATTVYGDSGGPLYNRYKLIGINDVVASYRGFPVFGVGCSVPIYHLKTWNKESNNSLEFVYKERRKMPVVPFLKLEMDLYDIKLPMEK